MADEIIRSLEYNYGQLHINTNLIVNVALLPAGSAQHSLVPEGNHRPALPLLTPRASAPASLTS
jgi:hypothetical protein